MKHLLLCLLLAVHIATLAQKPAITRFYQLSGTIDKYPVTFLLHRVNEDFSGTYYYHSNRTPIEVLGKMEKNGMLKLTYLGNSEAENEIIQGTFSDTAFSGTWQSKGKSLTMRVMKPTVTPTLSFDYVWTHGTKKIAKKEPHLQHIDEQEYDGRAVWPAAGSTDPAVQVVQQTIRAMLGDKNSQEEPGKIMLDHMEQYLDPKKNDDLTYYEISEAVTIAYLDNKLLVLSHFSTQYTGGAHGYYATFYQNIDLPGKRKLWLNDVLDSAAASKTAEKLLAKDFVKQFPLDDDQKINDVLLAEKITLTENFMLGGKGIFFNYIPYEIAAYVYGQVVLFISYKDLSAYLKPEFKKLMGL